MKVTQESNKPKQNTQPETTPKIQTKRKYQTINHTTKRTTINNKIQNQLN